MKGKTGNNAGILLVVAAALILAFQNMQGGRLFASVEYDTLYNDVVLYYRSHPLAAQCPPLPYSCTVTTYRDGGIFLVFNFAETMSVTNYYLESGERQGVGTGIWVDQNKNWNVNTVALRGVVATTTTTTTPTTTPATTTTTTIPGGTITVPVPPSAPSPLPVIVPPVPGTGTDNTTMLVLVAIGLAVVYFVTRKK